MKILFVSRHIPYILEQVGRFVSDQRNSLLKIDNLEVILFPIKGKGVMSYLKFIFILRRYLKEHKDIDIVHAHGGHCGLICNFQKLKPVITSYHGSDIHSKGLLLKLSQISMHFSAFNIFVSKELYDLSLYKRNNYIVQPCGVSLDLIKPIEFITAREYLGWDINKIYVLFGGAYSRAIKNSTLAKEAVAKLNDVELIELKGYLREEISILMSACNCLLVTSFRESGPLVVKEAMACNCPIVTTDVGDVRWVMGDTEGCYITAYDAKECADKISQALRFSKKNIKTKGRNRIIEIGLSNDTVANDIYEVYKTIYKGNI